MGTYVTWWQSENKFVELYLLPPLRSPRDQALYWLAWRVLLPTEPSASPSIVSLLVSHMITRIVPKPVGPRASAERSQETQHEL